MNARERILAAAVRQYEEHGSRGATTRRIAEAAEVNEVTVFRHFKSKDRLLREALEWAALRTEATIPLPEEPRDPRAELTKWCDARLSAMYRARALIRTSMGEFEEHPDATQSGTEVAMRISNELITYLERLRARGMAGADVDAHAATSFLMGALFSDAMGRDIMPSRYPYPLAEAGAIYTDLFLRALGVDQAEA
ncbi:MAG: TetR/AcrR family transcriptional regulator [Longimicrobiales bacterium]